MSGIKYWFEKISYSIVDRFIIFIFGFGTYFLIVRYLDKSEFGVYTLFFVITNFIEVARVSFIQNGFVKHYVDKSYNRHDVFTSSLLLNILLTVVTSSLLYLISDFLGTFYNSTLLSKMLKIYCFASFLLIPFTQLSYILKAEMNFKIVSLISFVRYASFFISVVYAYYFTVNWKPIEFVFLQAVSIGIGGITALAILFFQGVKIKKINKAMFIELVHFGKYTFGVGLTSLITRSVDQLMIGYFISSEAVASYNVAGRFLNFIEIPIASISQVIYPKFAQTINLENPDQERARLFEKSTGTILAAITPFVLLIFFLPSFFITIVAGKKYLDAVPILQIFILFNLAKPFSTQAGAILEVSGKPKIGFYALLSSSLLNIILNYCFIPMENSFGGNIGAAMASIISGSFFVLIVMIYIYRQCKTSLLNVFQLFLQSYMLGVTILKKHVTQKLK